MNIALLGYGKMGKTIEKLALDKGHDVVYKKAADLETGIFSEAEIAIEFSTPEVAVENIKYCFDRHIPVVSGTTGWLSEYDSLIKYCQKSNGSFIYASNFSIGVNLFFSLNEQLSKLMAPWKEYAPSIEEIHHTEKKDAPSGTAISLAEGILKEYPYKDWILDNEDENYLTIKAFREGDVKGTHSIDYTSKMDTIRIQHKAHSREAFALGAILAAEWLLGKQGIFTMKDVLHLKQT